jgi:1,4-dihydroxy-2-naphthoate octaprenyltransferase
MMSPWILAIRPKTLFASLAPVLLGLAVAYEHQHFLHPVVALLTLACAMLMQIGTNIANDYLDSLKGIDTDKRLGPTRVTHSGLIPADKMRKALLFVLSGAFILGIYLMYIGGPLIIFMGLLSLYFAYGYTGGPFPLSYNGLGEVAAFIFFGLIAVSGTAYLQTHEFSFFSFFIGMGPGFISATILAVNNLRDRDSDAATGKRTIAVRFGEYFQRKLCIGFIISSVFVIVAVAFYQHNPWLIPAILSPLLFSKNWIHIAFKPVDASMNQALARTAQYLLIYSLLAALGLLIGNSHGMN